jgi:hypothetical protein
MAMTTTTTTNLAEQLGITVGTIFYASWGYDQTNVDFYKVVEVSKSGKSVKIMECAADLVEGRGLVAAPDKPVRAHCQNCQQMVELDTRCSPVQWRHTWSDYQAEPQVLRPVACRHWQDDAKPTVAAPRVETKRIKTWGDGPVLAWTSYANLYRWDGAPKFDTIALGYAGH